MNMEIAISLLAFSAPITAGIVKFVPSRNGKDNGKYVTVREHDALKYDLGDRLNRIEGKLGDLNTFIKSRLD